MGLPKVVSVVYKAGDNVLVPAQYMPEEEVDDHCDHVDQEYLGVVREVREGDIYVVFVDGIWGGVDAVCPGQVLTRFEHV